MPKNGKYNKRSSRRGSAQTTIARAWRRRKARKVGLNARTTLANRRAIKKLARGTETKMKDDVQATALTQYRGQYLRDSAVDDNGLDSTGFPLVMRPMSGLAQGLTHATRVGDWIKLQSITFKFYVTPPTSALAPIVEEYNEVAVIIAMDMNPRDGVQPVLTGGSAGGLMSGALPNPMLKFYDINNVTHDGRYKILYKKIVRVAPPQGGVVGYLQSTNYPPMARWTHTVKAPYKIKYDSAAALSTRPCNQELCVFFFSDSANVPHPTVQCAARFRYKDA